MAKIIVLAFSVIALLLLLDFSGADENGSGSTDLEIISKAEWAGRDAFNDLTSLQHPIKRIVICHTSTRDCTSKETCSERVRTIQEFHIASSHFNDIAYNFLIGNDGRVYEGRGWDYEGAFARGFNTGSLSMAFIGTFQNVLPTQAALDALKKLLEEGVSQGKIDVNYKLLGHRQLTATESPGTKLYETIKQWDRWSTDISV